MLEILICDRMRPFLIYLIIKKGDIKNTILVTNDKFSHLNIFEKKIIYHIKKGNFLSKYLSYKLQERNLKKKNKKLLEKASKIVYGQRHILGVSFLEKRELVILEDGIKDYLIEKSLKIRIRNFLYKIPSVKSSKIKSYILTGIKKNPYKLEKVKEINLLEEWNFLDKEFKDKILKIFKTNYRELMQIEKNFVLITQPLSEDGIVSEKEKISIYKTLINSNSKENKLFYIKPHPRDKTNYNIFENVIVLKKEFPLELLILLGIFPEKIVTLFSTVALDFKNIGVETVYLGSDMEKIRCTIFSK